MKILGNENAFETFCSASELLNNAVKHTLGPNGLNTAITGVKETPYSMINDGKLIIERLTSEDAAIAPAVQTLKQASFETNRRAGDGTTSTIIMTNALLQAIKKQYGKYFTDVSSHRKDIIGISEHILRARDEAIDIIDNNLKRDIHPDYYASVATVSVGNKVDGDLIADAYRKVGEAGSVSLVYGSEVKTVSEVVDGISLDEAKIPNQAYISTEGKSYKEISDVDVVLVEEPIDRFYDLQNLVNIIDRSKTTIMFYSEMAQDSLENLVLNYINGKLSLIPIKLSDYGSREGTLFKDLSVYFDTKNIDGIDISLQSIKDGHKVGHCDYAKLANNGLIFRVDEPNERFKTLQANLANEDDEDSKRRHNLISSTNCVIKVGGFNQLEKEERYRRLEDAVFSLKSAIKYGVSTGGGVTYAKIYENMDMSRVNSDFEKVMEDTLYSIATQIAENEGKILDKNDLIFKIGPVLEMGNIYDSIEVIKEVINNSFTMVAQIIRTEKLIHDTIR